MLVWTDVPSAMEPAFDEWYVRRHMPERILGVPGFLLGRRFRALTGGPRHLALYELESTAVLQTEPYHALRRTRDPESRQLMPGFRNTVKAVGTIAATQGHAEGGVIAVLPLALAARRGQAVRERVAQGMLPEFAGQPGIVRARYVEDDPEARAAVLANNTRPDDRFLDALIIVEALSAEHLVDVCARPTIDHLATHGATLAGEPTMLTLRFAIRAGS